LCELPALGTVCWQS